MHGPITRVLPQRSQSPPSCRGLAEMLPPGWHRLAVMAILGVDADPNVTGNGGLTPLHGKAPPTSHQAAPWLWQCRLLSSADHHEQAGGQDKASSIDSWPAALFSEAARLGHRRVIELLLEQGARPTAVAAGGMTALHTACRFGRLGAVEALLAGGHPPQPTDIYGAHCISRITSDNANLPHLTCTCCMR